MVRSGKTSGGIWRWMRRMNGRVARLVVRGVGPGRVVLLLTTCGRRSGLPRVTPLQYEEIDGTYWVGSARGVQADWYRNIMANPHVEVHIKGQHLRGLAEPVCDPARVADFLALRVQRHPWMIGLIMRLEGLPLRYTRADLERFAAGKALVIIRPERSAQRPMLDRTRFPSSTR